MDVQPLLNQIADDESLTAGLADPEAKVLLDWLRQQIKTQVAHAATNAEGRSRFDSLRKRSAAYSRLIAAWCIDADETLARQLWKELGLTGSLDSLPHTDALAAMKQLLGTEASIHA
jgi:hypothetical protein